MALYARKRTPRVSEIPIKFKPFIGDHKEIMNLSTATGEPQAVIARDLIAEALKARRMKAIGKDEMSREVATVQKSAMYESQYEVREMLKRIEAQGRSTDDTLRQCFNEMIIEFDRAREQRSFIASALRFIVTEVIVCRHLLRDYVHTFYKLCVERSGRSTAAVEANFEARVTAYRMKAEDVLDRLSETSVGRLYEMADDEGSLDPTPMFARKTAEPNRATRSSS